MWSKSILGFGLLALLVATSCQADPVETTTKTRPMVEHEILEGLVFHNPTYNRNIRPINQNGSDITVVKVNFYLRHILSLDEEAGIWKVQLTFRQHWHDSRLVYDPVDQTTIRLSVPESMQNDIWVPDTFFPYEVDSGVQHKMLKPNSAIWIYPDGSVLASNRITISLACPQIRYSREPVCRIPMESYVHTAKNIVYQWKEDEPVQIPEKLLNVPWDVKDMADNLLPKGYTLKKFIPERCDHVTPKDTWSCIWAVFHFKKNDVCSA